MVYVNTWSGAYYGNRPPHDGGFLVALKDSKGTGMADVNERFGETVKSGGAGGTGIGMFNGSLYAEINDKIVRYKLPSDSIVPAGPPEIVVSGLPLGGDHPMHPFVFGSDGSMYVDVATATNACQSKNRVPHSRGMEPCTELKTRGGVWLYDATKTGQKFSPAERYSTGIRNAEGLAVDSEGRVFATQHGRDQLHNNWPELYKPEEEATQPAEVMMLLKKGGDYGWPECYYDPYQSKLVLAPEYGGDGGHTIGVTCTQQSPTGPVAVNTPVRVETITNSSTTRSIGVVTTRTRFTPKRRQSKMNSPTNAQMPSARPVNSSKYRRIGTAFHNNSPCGSSRATRCPNSTSTIP